MTQIASLDWNVTGKNGSLRTYEITGGTVEFREQIADELRSGYGCTVHEDRITGKGGNAELDRIDALVTRYNQAIARMAVKSAAVQDNAPRRELIRAGSIAVGQTLNGRIVVGLGREWEPVDHSAIGAHPSWDYVQYAYFS